MISRSSHSSARSDKSLIQIEHLVKIYQLGEIEYMHCAEFLFKYQRENLWLLWELPAPANLLL
jgi:hypothetical protein